MDDSAMKRPPGDQTPLQKRPEPINAEVPGTVHQDEPRGRETEDETSKPHKGVHFWGTFACLCVLAFISSLDVAIITTALPTVVAEIGGATQYIWIANSFVVASCVLHPLFGQLADILGRRIPLLAANAIFIVGSGVAGGAQAAGMLIAGRAIQGAGAAGIYVLIDVVCCDLVPMRERGKWLGLMFSWSGVAAALGPPVGGALAEVDWRWIFYLNIPICGAVMVGLVYFMRVKPGTSLQVPHGSQDKAGMGSRIRRGLAPLSRVDYLGNLIFIPSMISLLWGVVMGGGEIPWSSWRIVVPLVLGFLGWIAFHLQQTFFAEHPSIPSRLFANRTSATAFALTFSSSVIVQAVTYFFPIYLQAVQGTTALQSGTYLLPFAIPSLVFAVVGGSLLTKFGAYRPIHAVAFALTALSMGLFTILENDTSKAVWVVMELIASSGIGVIMPVLLPAIMAALPEGDVAASTAAYSFVRTFGFIWGVTLSGIVFNNVFQSNLGMISDPQVHPQLENGAAYAFASQMHRLRGNGLLPEQTLEQIEDVYALSLRAIWYLCMGASIMSFFLVGLEKSLKLRTDLDTEYGLDEGPRKAHELTLRQAEEQPTEVGP